MMVLARRWPDECHRGTAQPPTWREAIMTREISKWDDIIDSRDVIARIEELHALAEDEFGLAEDEAAELRQLEALAAQGEQYAEDWRHGEALIRESYFVAYAQELAEETVEGMRDLQWPFTHIDWEAAADELRVDYSEIEFDGVAYLIR